VLNLKELRKITVIGLGLLGGSASLAILRTFPKVKVVGYSHRTSTRQKAIDLAVATEVVDDLKLSVTDSDLVILATPIRTFEDIFIEIGPALSKGCIVTDVGSTKVLVHRWAAKRLGKAVHYVGSHPIAGSEQRGIEFSRDDLYCGAACILTRTKTTDQKSEAVLRKFWSELGCVVETMTPQLHDRIFSDISHIPHVVAAALINANDCETMKFAGKGFIDTSRIASGPANIWTDVLMTNTKNVGRGIDRVIAELLKLKKALAGEDEKQICNLLDKARSKRAALIKHKFEKKELL
jgi:prephenate dehydrogenase